LGLRRRMMNTYLKKLMKKVRRELNE